MGTDGHDALTQPIAGGGAAQRREGARPWPGLEPAVPGRGLSGREPVGPATGGLTLAPAAPRRARLPGGCLGANLLVALGVVLGILVALGWMAFAAPRVAPVAVGSASGGASVTVDDAFLSAAMRTGLSGAQLPVAVSDTRAHCLAGDRITVASTAGVGPLAAPLTITVQPVAQRGQLAMHVLSASVGSVPLPTDADAALEGAINAQLAATIGRILPGTDYVVRGVRTAPGQLILVLGPRG